MSDCILRAGPFASEAVPYLTEGSPTGSELPVNCAMSRSASWPWSYYLHPTSDPDSYKTVPNESTGFFESESEEGVGPLYFEWSVKWGYQAKADWSMGAGSRVSFEMVDEPNEVGGFVSVLIVVGDEDDSTTILDESETNVVDDIFDYDLSSLVFPAADRPKFITISLQYGVGTGGPGDVLASGTVEVLGIPSLS